MDRGAFTEGSLEVSGSPELFCAEEKEEEEEEWFVYYGA